MFTTDTREEAEALISLACPTNYDGEHIAPELSESQTIDNLIAFGDRLADLYERFIRKDRQRPTEAEAARKEETA